MTNRGGARVDFVATELDARPSVLQELGTDQFPAPLSAVLGTDDFDQEFVLASIFLTSSYALDEHFTLQAGAGRAERAPNLTELYAAEPFLFLQQNGLNSVTGDPRLKKEMLWQLDAGVAAKWDRFRASGNVFHAWIEDYVTFENMGQSSVLSAGSDIATRLKYVNTDLATLSGFDASAEADLTDMLTGFTTLSYVVGEDHTRDGSSATVPFDGSGMVAAPSLQDAGRRRGQFGQTGADNEPLPGIVPLESRCGLRWHEAAPKPDWAIELAARILDDQSRVAGSLRERPTPGFTIWDVRGYWRPTPDWLLTAGVENFTDKSYFEHLDYRSATGRAVFQPGLSFYLGSEWSF